MEATELEGSIIEMRTLSTCAALASMSKVFSYVLRRQQSDSRLIHQEEAHALNGRVGVARFFLRPFHVTTSPWTRPPLTAGEVVGPSQRKAGCLLSAAVFELPVRINQPRWLRTIPWQDTPAL